MRKLFCFLLLVFSCCFVQGLTGSQIPDATAQRLYFLSLTNMDSATRAAYLANVLVHPSDVNNAGNAVNTFNTNYTAAVNSYNNATGPDGSGFTPSGYNQLQSDQAAATGTALASLQTQLTPDGFAALQADIQAAKNNMNTNSFGSGGMACCYSTVETRTMTVLSFPPSEHVTVTVTHTLEGAVSIGVPLGITHQGSVTAYVGTHTQKTTGTKVAPNTYINISATVVLDSNSDPCLLNGGCTDNSDDEVLCSQTGTSYGGLGLAYVTEPAYTLVQWTGQPHGSCTVVLGKNFCAYPVRNWCTAGSTPPDNDFTGKTVSDFSAFGYWITLAECSRINQQGQPWSCTNAIAIGTNLPLPPASCTSHY